MSFIIGNGGPLNSFVVRPGQTMSHAYWWDNLPLGNDAWVATPLPPSIATAGATAYVVANGMNSTPRVTYVAHVRTDDGSQFAAYRLRVGQLA